MLQQLIRKYALGGSVDALTDEEAEQERLALAQRLQQEEPPDAGVTRVTTAPPSTAPSWGAADIVLNKLSQTVPPEWQRRAGVIPPIMDLMSKYSGEFDSKITDLQGSRDKAFDTYQNTINSQLSKAPNLPSNSEMWWKLAAAFAAPTKTGEFSENLALGAAGMGEFAKEKRIAQSAFDQQQEALQLKAAELGLSRADRDYELKIGTLTKEKDAVYEMVQKILTSQSPEEAAELLDYYNQKASNSAEWRAALMNPQLQAILSMTKAGGTEIGKTSAVEGANIPMYTNRLIKLDQLEEAVTASPNALNGFSGFVQSLQNIGYDSWRSADTKTRNRMKADATALLTEDFKKMFGPQISNADIDMIFGLQGIDFKNPQTLLQSVKNAKREVRSSLQKAQQGAEQLGQQSGLAVPGATTDSGTTIQSWLQDPEAKAAVKKEGQSLQPGASRSMVIEIGGKKTQVTLVKEKDGRIRIDY